MNKGLKYIIIVIGVIAASFVMTLFNTACSQVTVPAKDTAQVTVSDSLLPNLVVKVGSYTSTIDHTDFLVRRKYNIAPISLDLPEMERKLTGFKSRLAKRGGQMNLRGLNSSVIMLKEISDDLLSFQVILTRYSKELAQSNVEVKKILRDPVLKYEVADSILMEQIIDVRTEGNALDSLEIRTLSKINLLRNRVSVDYLEANDVMSDMRYLTLALKMGMWEEEERPLFLAKPEEYRRPLGENMINALTRSSKIIAIYIGQNWDVLTLGCIVFIFLFSWVLMNRNRIKKQAGWQATLDPVLVLRKSLLVGCLLAFFTYLPFLFANPVMSFLHACEILRLITLAVLIYPFLTRESKITGLLLALLWIVYALDDILLESAYGERWGLFFAGIILAAVFIKILVGKKAVFKGLGESPVTKTLVFFCLVQVLLSVVFNITGRVSLAKILGVSAIQCLFLGMTLKVFCTMTLEAIYMQSEAVQESRLADFINFKVLQTRF